MVVVYIKVSDRPVGASLGNRTLHDTETYTAHDLIAKDDFGSLVSRNPKASPYES